MNNSGPEDERSNTDLGFDRDKHVARNKEIKENVTDIIEQGEAYFEKLRKVVSEQITISSPWDYDSGEYELSEFVIRTALKHNRESRDGLIKHGTSDLKKLANRMEVAEHAIYEEDQNAPLYKSFYLIISTQNGLIAWLCENYSEVDPDKTTEDGTEVYKSSDKKSTLKDMYDLYAPFDIEDGGHIFKSKWENFWQHRHRVMHGHPDAHFDENLAVTALLFLSLTARLVLHRMSDLDEYDCSSLVFS